MRLFVVRIFICLVAIGALAYEAVLYYSDSAAAAAHAASTAALSLTAPNSQSASLHVAAEEPQPEAPTSPSQPVPSPSLPPPPRPTLADRLTTCSKYRRGESRLIKNRAGNEGMSSRVMLDLREADDLREPAKRFNPNILPYPAGAAHPYIGFARQSPDPNLDEEAVAAGKADLGVHTVWYCDLDWHTAELFDHLSLQCVEPPRKLTIASHPSPPGSCFLEQLGKGMGHVDPRVFFSPTGEPLMIVGTNGVANCLGQFIIDLRVLIPELGDKMGLQLLPVTYSELTNLPRDGDLHELEKNYFLMYDKENVPYVHHDISPRSFAALESDTHPNLALQAPAPSCISSFYKTFADDVYRIMLHQATNSLRMTLCDYPCTPTDDNTVLLFIFHVKYEHILKVYYRRYVVVTSAVAPFKILAISSNLVYLGVDERALVYTVQMAWDLPHFARKQVADSTLDALASNPYVSEYYHGWWDDTLFLSLGINDADGAVMFLRGRDLVECLSLCTTDK
ncbi:uncharacterized protein V1518DRAFT_416076 [Limtongia smithiae]|uniref:uncharacterized protein n=1 Tax=Limtongia smithiae TaxID=1125753 RepID=UPI0034CF09E2